MSQVVRNRETCVFRQRDNENQWRCELVSKVLGPLFDGATHVQPEACKACCQYPLYSEAQLNPVVASLVNATSQELQQHFPVGSREQVELQHARTFATRWLASVDRKYSEIDNCVSLGHKISARSHDGDMRIGLVGQHDGFGLAHQNRDIAFHLGVDRWLIPGQAASPPITACRIDEMSRPMSFLEMEAWLDGLDLVLFVERPIFSNITQAARNLGVRVACVANWEWIHPATEWLSDVDLMICPTRHTHDLLDDWQRRFSFNWDFHYVPWPVDVDRFEFRVRETCRRFVYVNGSGGAAVTMPTQSPDGSHTVLRRKGLDTVVAAAHLAPEIPIIVYASDDDLPSLPPNIELRPLPADNRLLYIDGDVCVQPSRWEGLGLPLLECQAAGMPLITSDAFPMCEHAPMKLVPSRLEAGRLTPEIMIPVAHTNPADLAAAMQAVHGRRIGSHSKSARRFVEREHNWMVALPRIRKVLRSCLSHAP